MKKKRRLWIKLIIGLLLVFIGPVAILLLAYVFTNSDAQPNNIATVMDFEGYDFEKQSAVNPYGDYHFYYNQWVETDIASNPDPIEDGIINLPQSWAGRRIQRNGETQRIGRDGYASYKMTMVNLKPGTEISFAFQDCGTPYQIYLNHHLVYQPYFLSKAKNKSRKIDTVRRSFKVDDTGIVDMVIEVGNDYVGGLANIPKLTSKSYSSYQQSAIIALIFSMVGICIAMLAVSIIIFVADFRSHFQLAGVVTHLMLLLHLLFSHDGILILESVDIYPSFFVFRALNITTFSILMIIFILFKKRHNQEIFRNSAKINIGIIGGLLLGIAILYRTVYASLMFIGFLLLMLTEYVHTIVTLDKNPVSLRYPLLAVFGISLDIGIIEALYKVGVLHLQGDGVLSYLIALLAFAFLVYFIMHYVELTRRDHQRRVLQEQHNHIRDLALNEEIKPHYIFNTLSVIKAGYRKSLSEGDKTIAVFSENIRQDIHSIEKELIPFEEEIDKINNYVDFENMHLEKPFHLLFNLDDTDFEIPPLSIEPLVENCVNYSRVNEKDDGYIAIKSTIQDNVVTIIVSDNGVGFNTDDIHLDSIGIRNVKERLRLTLDATVTIESHRNQGTTTTITFQRKPL